MHRDMGKPAYGRKANQLAGSRRRYYAAKHASRADAGTRVYWSEISKPVFAEVQAHDARGEEQGEDAAANLSANDQ